MKGQKVDRRAGRRVVLRSNRGARGSRFALLLLAALFASLCTAPAPAGAASPGGISGVVTDADTSNAVANVEVCAFPYSFFRDEATCASTDANGSYTLANLEAGQYHVWFHPSPGSNYAYQYFPEASTWSDGQSVVVSSSAVTGIDAALEPGGTISGTATANSGTTPVGGAEVCALEAEEGWETVPCVTTDGNGAYTLKGLPSGSYKVEFIPSTASNYARQLYDTVGNWNEATDVVVSAPGTTGGIDGHLRQAGRISGRVTASGTLLPIQNIHVCAKVTGLVAGEGLYEQCANTNSNGEYLLSGLASLYYDISFTPLDESGPNYIREYYNNKAFFYEADYVQVTAPGTTSGINAVLDPGGTIEGTVVDADTSSPIAGVGVCAYEEGAQGDSWGCTSSDAGGHYKMVGLASKQYRVVFEPPSGSGYLFQVYDDADRFYAGDLLTMTAPNVIPGIDAHLKKGAKITGKVTDEETGDPIHLARACAMLEGYDDPEFRHCASTNAAGEYEIGGLPAGPYTLEFAATSQGYLSEYYDDKTYGTADEFTLDYGTVKPDVNAALAKNFNPINEVRPHISGSPEVGGTLSCSTGTWGNAPTHFAFQWLREGNKISGATASTYTVQTEDLEKYLYCEVIAENAHGTSSITEWTYISAAPGPTQYQLAVKLSGSGAGSVVSSPAGINCGVVCTHVFGKDTAVTLSPVAKSGSTFSGWSGDCSGAGACVVAMAHDSEVTATFTKSEEGGGNKPAPSCATVPALCPPASQARPESPPAAKPGIGVAGNVALVEGGVALLTSRCPDGGACQGVAKLSVKAGDAAPSSRGAASAAKQLVIGEGRFTIPAGESGSVRIKLTGAGKQLVRKAGKHGLRTQLTGSGIKPRSILLKPKKKK